ncbi:MAG TPA: UDP-glucose 4-epimerase GalE [Candidatus Cloacimonadota bacterium]|nr:UDP-glucose 4-epimerase GalE [Candidatus Cloacimonadota bacterium]HPR18526.1 UDP-glucose 4-epimerase GalE [Candidatus Cloacimonadota bacterium]
MQILVTGGTGFIGSHAVVELLQAGHDVTIIDNLSNSKELVVERIEEITGIKPHFIKCDILDAENLDQICAEKHFDAVIHFAGLKAVGESVEKPLEYYHNNVSGTINLCRILEKHNIKNFIFSSSATVYGLSDDVPFTEKHPRSAINPYGQSKLMIEHILEDLYTSDPEWNIVMLRYFNPVGAHSSGLIGEDPAGIPNNLMPYISQVAVGKRPFLNVFGNDYPTPDGTGIRDYIHVVDLAVGHLKALDQIEKHCGLKVYNLGCGKGYSVLEMIKAFEQASGKDIPYKIVARRPGDAAVSYADATLANAELHWKAERGIAEMCRDSWKWQKENPEGFA